MAIQVRFFASLREKLGRAEESIDPAEIVTVADVWARVAGDLALPPSTLVAVNTEYAGVDQVVKDGDEVAFFPPVTGG